VIGGVWWFIDTDPHKISGMSRVLGMFEVKTLIYEAQERPVVFVAFGLQRVVFFTVGAAQERCFSPHVSCELVYINLLTTH